VLEIEHHDRAGSGPSSTLLTRSWSRCRRGPGRPLLDAPELACSPGWILSPAIPGDRARNRRRSATGGPGGPVPGSAGLPV